MLPPPPNTKGPAARPVGAGQREIFQGVSPTSEQSPFGCSEGVPKVKHGTTAEHTYTSGSIFGMSSTVNLVAGCEISKGMVSIDREWT